MPYESFDCVCVRRHSSSITLRRRKGLGVSLRSTIQTPIIPTPPLTHPPPFLSPLHRFFPCVAFFASYAIAYTAEMATSRTGFRFTQSARDSLFRNTPFARNQQQSFFRRFATAAPAVEGAPSQNIFQKLWNSPVGVKTVHFWYAKMRRGGIHERHADTLSSGHR